MEKKKILIIAYVFPPIAYAGTYRTLRLCKYLKKLNYEITVLTIKIQRDLKNDFTLLDEIKNKIFISRTPIIDIWRSYSKRLKPLIIKLPFGSFINRIIAKFIFIFNIPDHMIGWIPFAYFNAIKILKHKKYTLIYTSSPPHSQQLIGSLIKKKYKIKWVADLRDPIVDNLGKNNIGNFENSVLKHFEKKILSEADVIICNTENARNLLNKKFPKSRIEVIHNSFDEDDFYNIVNYKYKYFTLSHIGSIYNFRKVDHILNAVNILRNKDIIKADTFRIKFVGINESSIYQEIIKFNLESFIDVYDIVEHKEAIKIMNSSHMLLLIKGFGKNSGGQIPGKLFEYIASGKPILCIAPLDSEAARIVAESGRGYVLEDDPEQIAEKLHLEYMKYINGEFPENFKDDCLSEEQFSSRKMAQKFDTIFTNLFSEKE